MKKASLEARIERASLMAQMVRNLPAMQETWIQSLTWEDPREKGMATLSSILAWRIPWTEEAGRLQSKGHKELDMTEQLTLKIIFMRAGILSYFRRL